ncbi:hypothetical protein FA95DRAFT_1611724 [Auriscalpium vulgare]|uniref:Uncharacterized protein n=1 Tax=Auriscalpium vulgare TaxID=40419 RepID=A0ACB8RA93_9AGAM|nr:hypothetical protein FA95DRAFT_1611724 [Auriscalpium vulgare]
MPAVAVTGIAFYVTLPPSTRYLAQFVVAADGVVSFVIPGSPVEQPDENGVTHIVAQPPLRSMKTALSLVNAEDMDRIIAYVPRPAGTSAAPVTAGTVKLNVAITTDEKGEGSA